MLRNISWMAGATAITALSAGLASADVTPEQVWADWQARAARMGQEMTTASESRDGADLVIEGVKIAAGRDGGVIRALINELRLRDQGDGTVAAVFPATIPAELVMSPPNGTPATIYLNLSQDGLRLVASGQPDAISYDYAARGLTAALDRVEGFPDAPDDLAASLTLTDLSGQSLVSGTGAAQMVTSTFGAGTLAAALTGTGTPATESPDSQSKGPVSIDLRLSVADLAAKGSVTGADLAQTDVFSSALKGGFASQSEASYGPFSFVGKFSDADGPASFETTSAGGMLRSTIDATRLAVSTEDRGASMTLRGGTLPVPQVTLGYGSAAFGFSLPTLPSDKAGDFSALMRIVDLAVPPELWSMFDPAQQLPQDPATLVLDIRGKARLLHDVFDPANATATTPPVEVQSLDLAELHLKLAGADLTGNGALTFDNSDTVTFGGMPAPTGKLDFRLTGGNGLIDKLLAIGLVPEDQVMGLRMMLAMFATAAADKDEMTSTLEFRDKGFYANGQRLK